MRLNRRHNDVNRVEMRSIHCFTSGNTDYRAASIYQAVQRV
jgi:hypothetical protein